MRRHHLLFWIEVRAAAVRYWITSLPWKLDSYRNRIFVCNRPVRRDGRWARKGHHLKMDSHGHCYRCGRWVWASR